MKEVYSQGNRVRKTIARDAHNPNIVYHETVTNEAPVIDRNQQIRSAGLLMQDSRNSLVPEGDVIAFAFQFPTTYDYYRVKKLEGELFDRIAKGGDDGLKAAERLSILYPQYVTITRRTDARRTTGPGRKRYE